MFVGAVLNPIKLIHTGDVHLDQSFAGQSLDAAVAARKRKAIREVLRDIAEAARSADGLLIAGDLFEPGVRKDTILFCSELFKSISPTPVYIAPGNHDPYNIKSPYTWVQWPANVHVFKSEKAEIVDGPEGRFRVMGFAHTSADMTRRIISELTAPEGAAPVVLLAHAAQVDNLPEDKGPYAPFVRAELEGKRFAYVALGHYHGQRPVLDVNPPAWYCGSPEPLGYTETDSGGYLEVLLSDSGAAVRPRRVLRIPYARIEVDLEGATSSSEILDRVRARACGAIAEITLTGTVAPDVDLDVEALVRDAKELFVNLAIRDQTSQARDYEAMAREPTSVGEFVAEMLRRIRAAQGEDRKILEQALHYGLAALEGRELKVP